LEITLVSKLIKSHRS